MDSSRPPRTTPRKYDAKKEVDTARRRVYLFFVARFPWAAFPWRLDDAAPVEDRARRRWTLDRPRHAAAPRRADDARAGRRSPAAAPYIAI